MRLKLLASFVGLTLAFGILFISLFRAASVKYEFGSSGAATSTFISEENGSKINYILSYPGKVLPDSAFWPLKAARDRVWLFVTPNSMREAELKLLFADKRLGMAKILFEKGNSELGFSTLTKAEKYLEEASWQEKQSRNSGVDTSQFLEKLANASLKHFEVMERLKENAPEEARPKISETQDYSKRAYEAARNALLQKGLTPPENPFAW